MTSPRRPLSRSRSVAPCHYRRRVIVGADCVGCLPIVVRTAANESRPGTPGAWSPRSVALRACLRGHVGSGTAPTRPHASLKRDGTLPVRFFVSSVQSSGANRGPVAPSLGCDSGRRSRYAFECWSVSPTGESSSDGAAGSLSLASLEDPPSAPGLPGWSSGAPDSCGSLRSGAVSMIDRLAFRWVDVSVLPAEAGDQVSLAATSERRAAAVRSVSKTCR